MESNPDTNTNVNNPVNPETEKKVETSRNDLNTKSDINLNINNSFEDFEQKFQELKLKINQDRAKDPRIASKFVSTVGDLNLKVLNDNSLAKSRFNELYTIIGGNSYGKIGLITNKPPVEFNVNSSINTYNKKNDNFYIKDNNNKKNTTNVNFKNLNYKSPIKSNNLVNSKSYSHNSFSSERTKFMNKNEKKGYADLFKPVVLNSIKLSSNIKTSNDNNNNSKKIEIQIPKRGNIFNKNYFKNELDNLNSLLFGTPNDNSFRKNEEEVYDPFYSSLNENSKKTKFTIESGNKFMNKYSKNNSTKFLKN